MVDIEKAKANIDKILEGHMNGSTVYLAMTQDTYGMLTDLFQGSRVYNGVDIVFEEGLLDGEIIVTKSRMGCPTCGI